MTLQPFLYLYADIIPGDPARALLFRAIINEIERLNLVQNTAETGDYLFSGLENLAQKYPKRDDVLRQAKSVGINVGGSGERAVRLRPMLIFQKRHADIFLEGMEKVFQMA
jgi:4-aminobutyrate aminotransferase/(S)-3-amino-2-methylpropionate transaminase